MVTPMEKGVGRERRQFERVEVPSTANLIAISANGKRMGVILELGRGGMSIEPESKFSRGTSYALAVFSPSDHIRIEVRAVACHVESHNIGLEFEDLSPEAAIDIGGLMGKYYLHEG